MSGDHAETFERCMAVGGIAVFPADTVYGLACDPDDAGAVRRLYALKGRSPAKASAVMFFRLEIALDALPEIGERTRDALRRLLPGPVTVLLDNPERRFPLACGADPATLGLRVVDVPGLRSVRWPVLQSSANRSGAPEARRVADVDPRLRRSAEMVIDGGELPGRPSTVVDLRRFETGGEWSIVRQGWLAADAVQEALEGRVAFDPSTYDAMIRADIPAYAELQQVVAAATGGGARRLLELGTGTGETAARLLERHPDGILVGVDESAAMLAVARDRLPAGRVRLVSGRLQDPLPPGSWDVVASALCVHHLDGPGKRDLFARVRADLAPDGRFVLGDVVVPTDPADRVVALTDGFDRPDRLADQLLWLAEAGFVARVEWTDRDLAVVVAEPG